jgi:uncharacterized Zn finger protein
VVKIKFRQKSLLQQSISQNAIIMLEPRMKPEAIIMKLNDLLGKDILSELATPSNLKLGEEIFKSGRVEVLSLDESHAAAKVSGEQKYKQKMMG